MKKVTTCARCGRALGDSRLRMDNRKYICKSCTRTQPYSTRNNKRKNISTKKGLSVGFEFECVPKSTLARMSLLKPELGLIPTRDGSLPYNGIEYKSSVYNSFRGLSSLFEKMDKYARFTSPDCGQHINMSHDKLKRGNMYLLLNHYESIFYPLSRYMEGSGKTESICGREANFYCRYPHQSYMSSSAKYQFIHLKTQNAIIEYRISKFVTPKQYLRLTHMWGEMTIALANWAHKTSTSHGIGVANLTNVAAKSADALGRKLVKIFQKYESGLES